MQPDFREGRGAPGRCQVSFAVTRHAKDVSLIVVAGGGLCHPLLDSLLVNMLPFLVTGRRIRGKS